MIINLIIELFYIKKVNINLIIELLLVEIKLKGSIA